MFKMNIRVFVWNLVVCAVFYTETEGHINDTATTAPKDKTGILHYSVEQEQAFIKTLKHDFPDVIFVYDTGMEAKHVTENKTDGSAENASGLFNATSGTSDKAWQEAPGSSHVVWQAATGTSHKAWQATSGILNEVLQTEAKQSARDFKLTIGKDKSQLKQYIDIKKQMIKYGNIKNKQRLNSKRMHAARKDISAEGSRTSKLNQIGATPTHGTGPQTTDCGTRCPPPWVSIVNKLPTTVNVTSPLCEFSELFTPCATPRVTCKTEPVQFKCCPRACLPSIANCYSDKTTANFCIPISLQPWIKKMKSLMKP